MHDAFFNSLSMLLGNIFPCDCVQELFLEYKPGCLQDVNTSKLNLIALYFQNTFGT